MPLLTRILQYDLFGLLHYAFRYSCFLNKDKCFCSPQGRKIKAQFRYIWETQFHFDLLIRSIRLPQPTATMMSSSSRKPRSPFAGHQREPDPLASPCICGFRKKCGKELLEKHFLSAVDLHGDSYRSQCWKMFANKSKLSKKESAVDHIIELHQVKTGKSSLIPQWPLMLIV